MSALTSPRNTIELHTPVPHYSYELVVASGKAVYAGGLVAVNASGYAEPADDATGLAVLGRAENSGVAGETVTVRTGVYLFDNGTSTEALTAAEVGKVAYALDDHTVGKAGGTYAVPVGIVAAVNSEGVAVEVTPVALATAAAKIAGARQGAAVADCTAAGGSATSVETQLNALLASLRTAGIIATE